MTASRLGFTDRTIHSIARPYMRVTVQAAAVKLWQSLKLSLQLNASFYIATYDLRSFEIFYGLGNFITQSALVYEP